MSTERVVGAERKKVSHQRGLVSLSFGLLICKNQSNEESRSNAPWGDYINILGCLEVQGTVLVPRELLIVPVYAISLGKATDCLCSTANR